MEQITRHTVTVTRELQTQVADLFGHPNFFKLDIDQIGTKRTFRLTWGGIEVATFASRKAVHEWVLHQIALRQQQNAANAEQITRRVFDQIVHDVLENEDETDPDCAKADAKIVARRAHHTIYEIEAERFEANDLIRPTVGILLDMIHTDNQSGGTQWVSCSYYWDTMDMVRHMNGDLP